MQAFRHASLLKRDSNAGVFLWILQKFQDHLFWRTSANDCFFNYQNDPSSSFPLAHQNSWTLDASIGPWTLNTGHWTLNLGLWTPNTRLWTLKLWNLKLSKASLLNSTLIKISVYFRYENISTVYSFKATISNHLKMSKTRGLQMMWRGSVDLKWINMVFCFW